MTRRFQTCLRRDERGQALVEFAMVIGFLVIFVVGILEMSLFLYNYAWLTDAAKEGVRYAIVHGASGSNPAGPTGTSGTSSSWSQCTNSNSSSAPSVASAVKTFAAASLHNISSMNVYVCYPDGNNNPGSGVQVSVSYPYSPLFLTNWATIPISASSVGRIQF
ncbi:MAG TPA: TadE/TadG family type IV pilus assembly protein [Terriglobales bacterium]|nr:TadE/TadG family type IV pilus assembly protein [Terriglobales bacterium]